MLISKGILKIALYLVSAVSMKRVDLRRLDIPLHVV